jgi:hypothetical protein
VRQFAAAVGDNKTQLVRQMLAEGMDTNQILTPSNGERALHLAAAWGRREMIDCLLDAGADPIVYRKLNSFTTLLPSGMADLVGYTENAKYLRDIEHRAQLLASGRLAKVQYPGVQSTWRFHSRPTKSSRGPKPR